jgi:hypothetical protein
MVLAHTVEAMVGDTVKRVHCNTCMSQHAFKAHAPGEGPAKAKKKAPARKKATSKSKANGGLRASDYDKYMEGRDMSAARRYNPSSAFVVGEVVNHPKFGTGVATQMKGATKIEVLFQDGPRVLVHAK